VRAKSDDKIAVKALITVAVYLALVFALGLVMAMTAPREEREAPMGDDDF
jgi:hypothetical protein